MKRVSDITKGLDPRQALAQIPMPQPIKVDQQTAEYVNTVFDKLQGIYPAWRQAWTDDAALKNAKREWIAGFIQGGINSEVQLAYGFQHARKDKSPFLPKVGQFVAWCKPTPESMGLPCEAQAWDEARAGKYSHPAVRIAAEATSTYDLHTCLNNDKALKQRFERNYAIVMRRAQTGQPLEGRIAKGLSHDSMRPREQVQLEYSRQEAERIVDKLQVPRDPKAARYQLLDMLKIRRDEHA